MLQKSGVHDKKQTPLNDHVLPVSLVDIYSLILIAWIFSFELAFS